MNDIKILLPEKLYILKNKPKQDIENDREEYSIYYKNIIESYSADYDVEIVCRYGRNLDSCWRIDSFDGDMGDFDLTVKVYDIYGRLLAEKTCLVEALDKKPHEKINLLCIGDSMTRGEIYIQQAAEKVRNVNTLGLRSIKYSVSHEGRGGWKSYDLFERFEDDGMGVSPFLFPECCKGREYFGSKRFWERVSDPEYNTKYQYTGIAPQKIREGMVCCDNGAFFRYTGGEYIKLEGKAEFKFDIGKYIERYDFPKPDIISILFGANEFQNCGYEAAEGEVNKYIKTIKAITEAIKAYDRDIGIVINMPVCGGGQYAWGMQMGCKGTAKQYDYCIKKACEAVLKEFDGRQNENIFVCPMLAVCDTVSGFEQEARKMNIYSDMTEMQRVSWVHPSETGYRQMGDALAGVVAAMSAGK